MTVCQSSNRVLSRLDWIGQEYHPSLAALPTRKNHEDVSRARARSLPEAEAHAVVKTVASLLFEEQQLGTFGTGDDAAICSRLSGACCIAAVLVAIVLERRGFSADVVGGALSRTEDVKIRHWWALTPDGWMLDPTYGQFSFGLEPLATKEENVLYPLGIVDPHEFIRWDYHPSLPGRHRKTIDRILTRITGRPYE